jgi:hypothetical protein
VGFLHLGLSAFLIRNNREREQTANLITGLTLVNAGFCMKISDLPVLVFGIAQIFSYAMIGLRRSIKAFRWFSICLTFFFLPYWLFELASHSSNETILGLHAPQVVLLGLLAIAVFIYNRRIYLSEQFVMAQGRRERSVFPHLYALCANSMAFAAPFAIDNALFRLPCWTTAGLINAETQLILQGAGIIERNPIYFLSAGSFIIVVCIGLLITIGHWQWLPIVITISLFYAAHFYYRTCDLSKKQQSRNIALTSLILANTILTTAIMVLVTANAVSVVLGIEAVSYLIIGFRIWDKAFRVSGLCILTLLTGKLLFVDFAQADTIQRIISFIAAGVIFLISSYAYSWFIERLRTEHDSTKPNTDGLIE